MAAKESIGELPNAVKHRLQDFGVKYYALKMLKNKNSIHSTRLPDYLSFFKEDMSEPVKFHLQAFKSGEYNIEDEEEVLKLILKQLSTGKA